MPVNPKKLSSLSERLGETSTTLTTDLLKNRLAESNTYVGNIAPTYGESQYDESAPVPSVLEGSLEDYRGEVQTRLDKMANAVPRLLSKVGTEIAKTPGYVYALGESGLTDKTLAESLDNAWLNNLDKFDQSVKKQFEIYKPKSVREGNIWDNLTSTSFWTDEGVDGAGFLLSMIAPGAALKATGIAGKLAKLPVLSKIGASNIELGQATLLNTSLESAAEAKGIVDNLKEQFNGLLNPDSPTYNPINPKTGETWTKEEVNNAIGEAGVSTFQMNMGLLLVPNIIMNKNLLGRFNNSKTILDEFKDATGKFVTTNPIVKKSLVKEYSKGIGEAALSEGFLEEAGQTTIENYNKKVALNQTNGEVLTGLASEYLETLASTEGQKAILLGSVLGSLGGATGKSRQLKQDNITRSKLTDLINDNFEGFSVSMDNIIDKDEQGNVIIDPETNSPKINVNEATKVVSNLVKEQQSTNLQDLEALKGNKDLYDYIFNQQLSRFAIPYLQQEGGEEILNQHIDNLSKDLTKANQNNFQENEFKGQIKSQIKDLKSVYTGLVDTINNLPLEQLSNNYELVGKFSDKLLNTAYQESSKQLFLTKKIKELSNQLLSIRATAQENVSQFNIEAEKLTNRIESLNQSLEISKENYNAIFDPEQQKAAFEDFSVQEEENEPEVKQEVPIPETSEPVEETPTYTQNSELDNEVKQAKTKEDLDSIFDKYFDETNGEELENILTSRNKVIDEQNSHLVGVDQVNSVIESLNKEDHEAELRDIKSNLESIKNLTSYDNYDTSFKQTLEDTLGRVNNVLDDVVSEDDNIVNEASNNTISLIIQNQDIESTNPLGLQDSIQNVKSFSTKVYNTVMMKLFESKYSKGKGLQFVKNNEGEAVKTSTTISMVVNNPNIVKKGDVISFEITTLEGDQNLDNEANIAISKEIINRDTDDLYSVADKEFGKYYRESIAIRHKDSNEIIGFVALPHALSEVSEDTIESKQARLDIRNQLIAQRKRIIDLLNNNEVVETTIFDKGPGKLLLKSDKDGIPIMSSIISRNQDLIDGRDIYVVDKGYDLSGNIEGFGIPNKEDFVKASDRLAINELFSKLSGRTFSDTSGNNKGRVFKAVKNSNNTWSLIPVYATSIGAEKAEKIIKKLKTFVSQVGGVYTPNLKAIYSELGKDVYITNTDKRGVLKIDNFKINGKQWGALFNNPSFEKELLDNISKAKNNIITQLLNTDNGIKDILETNAYQEDGEYFVQPYIEFTGIQTTNVVETQEIIEEKPINSTEKLSNDKLDLPEDVLGLDILDEEVFTSKSTKGKLNRKNITEFLETNLPGITLADQDLVSQVKPYVKDAVGMFYRSTIYLFKDSTNNTAYHEAFHGVFRNILSVDERSAVIHQAKAYYSAPSIEELNNLSYTITPETRAKLTEKQLTDALKQLYYEEKLADSFADYTELVQEKTLGDKIKDFFRKLFRIFNLFKRYNEDQITSLFDSINTGKYSERSKTTQFDRAITSELLNPAYKKPDNIPISEFLDRSKSIEDVFYYRLNQQLELGLTMEKIRIGDIFNSIRQDYRSKAIEFNKVGEKYKSAVSTNVYNNWDSYVEQVIANLQKRKIKIKVKDNNEIESLDTNGIPDTTNNVENMDIENVEVGINKSYGQEMTAISGIRSAGDKLKLFLSALPILEDNRIKTDAYGFEQFYDYERIYYQLEIYLLEKPTFEEQYDEIKYLATYKPEMYQVLKALDTLKGESGEQIKKQFRTNFYKQQLKFKLVLFEKSRADGKYSFKIVDSNRKDIKRSITSDWTNNLIDPSRTKENLVRFENSEYKLDQDKIKKLVTEFENTALTEDYAFNTLYRLGIEFKREDFSKVYKSNEGIISTNIKNYLNSLASKEVTRKGREAFEWFVNQQVVFNQSLFTQSFNNTENSIVYSIQNNSFSSRLVNKLTKGNNSGFINDLKRDPIYKYLSMLEAPYIAKSLRTFAIDGLKDGVGENIGKKYRSIHPDDYTAMAIAAYLNESGNQSTQGLSTAIYTPIVPSEKTQAFLNQGPKYLGFIINENGVLEETSDTQRFNKIFWLEADRIKRANKDRDLYNSETELINQGRLDKRTFNPNPNYHGKNFNGNAYKFSILNYSKALDPKGDLYNAIFNEFNNSELDASQFFGDSRKFVKEINAEILTILNNKYKNQLDSLIDSGIIKTSSEGLLTSNVIDLASYNPLQQISEDSKLKNLVAEFTLNTSLFNIEYSLLMNGDPAYYKDKSDWAKRFYQSQAETSSYDSSDFEDGRIQIMAFNDIEESLNKDSYNDIIEMTKDLPNNATTKSILDSDYSESNSINVADAQFYVSDDLYAKLLKSQGKTTFEISKALAIGNGSTQGINSRDYHQQLSILKTFTYGVQWNDNTARYEPIQIKCAVLPLTPSLVADNPLLKKSLDRMKANPDGPQAMAFKSTFKALQPSYQNIEDVENFDISKVVNLEVENMGLQVDNPNHGLDGENSSTRQLKMLFYGMLDNETSYNGVLGKDIKYELQQLESKNNLESLNKLLDLFNRKDERLLRMIQEAATKRNATSIVQKVFDIDPNTGDFRYPLDTLPTRQTIELLSSIFTKNVVLQEFRGGAMVQASALGFQFKSEFSNLEEQQALVEGTKELSDIQTSLKWIRKEDDTKIDYIEVALPYYYSDFLDNNGQFKKDIPEELLRIIGYRIPTEGAHSMLPLKVVKFLPKEYGNVILLPYEITKQMGADFDFDKIYFLSREYYMKGKALEVYKYSTNPENTDLRYEQYINSVLNENKEALKVKRDAREDAKAVNKLAREAGEEEYKYTFQDDINLLVDEGYIISREDFNNLGIEDQLTKEARNNRILDLYTAVLRDVNTLNSLIAPSGPGDISLVYNEVAKYKTKETQDYFSFLGQLGIKKLFDDIIGLKGQSALKVTGHSFVSLGNLIANENPFSYREGENVTSVSSLSQTESRQGNKIVEELSSMMAAILDAVKTPTMLPYLNISSKTINIWSTIVRFGMGTKVASEFTAQESVGIISERLMSNDKQIKDGNQFNNKVVDEVFDLYKSKFLAIYNNYDPGDISLQLFGRSFSDTKTLNNLLNSTVVDLDKLTIYTGKSEDVVRKELKDEKLLLDFYLTQMNVVKSFQNLESLSKKLQQVDSIFGLNKEVGPTFETTNGKQEVISEVNTYEADEDGSGVFIGIQDLLQEPIINSYININTEFFNQLNDRFGFANEYYNSIKRYIAKNLNVKNDRGLTGLKPKDRDSINSFITTYLDAYSTMADSYNTSSDESGFTDTELVDEITKLKSPKFDEKYEWKIFGGKTIKQSTKRMFEESSLMQHLKTRILDNSNIKVISLKGNRLELSQKEKIIADINKLYKNPNSKGLIEGLVNHSFKYSGFYTGLDSYHSLIDPEILQEMGFVKNRQILKEIINSNSDNTIKSDIFVGRLIDQLIRNNVKLTKTFDLDLVKGDSLFIKTSDGFRVNYETTHPRSTELFKLDDNGEYILNEYIRIYLDDKAQGFKGSKLFKLEGNVYKETSKLGIPGHLVEINPFFDLQKSTYQPNNYTKFGTVVKELTPSEEQVVEGENNEANEIKDEYSSMTSDDMDILNQQSSDIINPDNITPDEELPDNIKPC